MISGATLQTIFGLVAIIAAALAAIQFGSLKTLRESNEDLRKRDGDRTIEMTELKAKVNEQALTIEALGKVVTGEAYLTAISHDLERHHTEATAHWVTIEASMERLADATTKLYDRLALPVRRDSQEDQ